MDAPALTPEQQAEAERLLVVLRRNIDKDLQAMAELLASKPDSQLLGATEFQLRDRALAMAALALETALNERKKGGTKAPASPVPNVVKTPSSNAGKPKPG